MLHIFITHGRKRGGGGKLYIRSNLCIREERSGEYSTVIPSYLCTEKYACTAASVVSQGKHKHLHGTCVLEVSLESK